MNGDDLKLFQERLEHVLRELDEVQDELADIRLLIIAARSVLLEWLTIEKGIAHDRQ